MAQADRLIDLFNQAQSRPTDADRQRFLAEVCPDSRELREQVLSLLRASDRADGIIKTVFDSSRDQDKAIAGDVIGAYKLRETLGEGGCGVVYVAEQEKPVRRLVALKIIKPGMDTRSVVARFESERQALAVMEHPNIAKVLEAGATDSGRPYFVMELVRGVRIAQYCDENQLSVRERLQLFVQVCQAIQHAHQKGIIHRDIKPSNILVTLQDGTPVPKVIDFGIAKATEGRLSEGTVYTHLHHFIGTPAYMSPEQAEMSGLDVDTRADIYSLGVVLYELLAGCTPFDAKELTSSGLEEMRRTIREKEPARPSVKLRQAQQAEHAAGSPSKTGHSQLRIDADLDWIVMKCLEKDRKRRYATANDLAADVTRYLQSEPVAARPPSRLDQIHKSFRRHKVTFAAGSVMALSLVIALFASVWKTIEVARAQREKMVEVARAQRETDRQAYAARMGLARQAWEDNDLARLRTLLKETAAYPDRGFEWFYWQRQAHLDHKTLRGHLGPVLDVSFSPDGTRVLTASMDHTAKIWDARDGTVLRTFRQHKGAVNSAAWSSNGQWVVTACADGTAAVWNANTGELVQPLLGRIKGLTTARFSPDGQQIITGSLDGTARRWRAATGEQVLPPFVHGGIVWSAAFSSDGRRILTAGSDENVIVWDATTGDKSPPIQAPRTRTLGVMSPAFCAGFSPDGNTIVTVSQDQTAALWNASSGMALSPPAGRAHLLSPRQFGLPLTANFSPDGDRFIVGGLDFTATVWDKTGQTNLFTLKGHEAEIVSAAFSPDGKRIVTGSYDHTAKIWSGTASAETLPLVGQTNLIPTAAFSPHGERIVTGSWDGTAVVWNATTGERLLPLNHGSNAVWSVAFSPDATRIATGTRGGRLYVWDAFTARKLWSVQGHGTNDVFTIQFSEDGKRILTGGGDRTARLWDAVTGQELGKFEHNYPAVFARFAPGSRQIVSVCNDNDRNTQEDATGVVWDAETGQKLFPLKDHLNGFRGVAWSANGQFIVTGCVDWKATVWDAVTGQARFPLTGHHGQVMHIAISPDGRRIFTGGFDNTTRVWDAATGAELLTLKGGLLDSPGISPDGRQIVLGAFPPAYVVEAASPEEVERWNEEKRQADARIERERRDAELGQAGTFSPDQ
jgi:eukaryotic-like serine/threonine-protein kinase